MLDPYNRKGRILPPRSPAPPRRTGRRSRCSTSPKPQTCRCRSCAPSSPARPTSSPRLLRAVDDEVLKRAAKRAEGQEKRDLLFDIVMTRFDVLAPYKAGAEIDPRLRRGRLRAGGSLSLLPALDAAGRRHRHRRRDGRPARGGPRPRLRLGVPDCGSRTTIRASPRPWRRSTGGCGAASARSAASSRCTPPCRASARPCRSWRATRLAAATKPSPSPGPEAGQV